jgi:uncharacterized protein YbdZ (MbtH family)
MMSLSEDPDASYLVLLNAQGQCSLWPAFADVPCGWKTIFNAAYRDCVVFIDQVEGDMYPGGLIEVCDGNGAVKGW